MLSTFSCSQKNYKKNTKFWKWALITLSTLNSVRSQGECPSEDCLSQGEPRCSIIDPDQCINSGCCLCDCSGTSSCGDRCIETNSTVQSNCRPITNSDICNQTPGCYFFGECCYDLTCDSTTTTSTTTTGTTSTSTTTTSTTTPQTTTTTTSTTTPQTTTTTTSTTTPQTTTTTTSTTTPRTTTSTTSGKFTTTKKNKLRKCYDTENDYNNYDDNPYVF